MKRDLIFSFVEIYLFLDIIDFCSFLDNSFIIIYVLWFFISYLGLGTNEFFILKGFFYLIDGGFEIIIFCFIYNW